MCYSDARPQSESGMAPAFTTILQMAEAYVVPRCLHVAAQLGIADVLGQTPLPLQTLAHLTGTNEGALRRLLRLLSAHGVFELGDDGCSDTPASRLLRTDHPQSMRAFVRMVGLPLCWSSFGDLEYSIKTGCPRINAP